MLSLIPFRDWCYLGAIVALLIGFGVYTKHERNIGAAHEVAALKESSDKLQKDTDRQTADIKAKADMAEQAHAKEILALSNRPPSQPVRLCLDTHRGSVVPAGGATNAGNAATGPSAAGIQRMPTGDSGSGEGTVGPDISKMLTALGASADTVSATLREYQSR